MDDGITVKEFKYIPGVNDAEYIKKLEKLHENDRRIINTAVAKIKKLTSRDPADCTGCVYKEGMGGPCDSCCRQYRDYYEEAEGAS